jgi:hypothetical protein
VVSILIKVNFLRIEIKDFPYSNHTPNGLSLFKTFQEYDMKASVINKHDAEELS